MNTKPPYDQRIARFCVKYLVDTSIRPNHLTYFTLVLAVTGAVLLASGDFNLMNWGAGLFVLARFFDHFDGELARAQHTSSRLGYYLDYIVGAVSYSALFVGMGIGLVDGVLGNWAVLLGVAGGSAAWISLFTNLGIDRQSFDTEAGDSVGYPQIGGFELEDGIYLLAPITWFGFIEPFFIAAGIGATIYCIWSIWTLVRLRSRQ